MNLKLRRDFKILNQQTLLMKKDALVTDEKFRPQNWYWNILPFRENIAKPFPKQAISIENYLNANIVRNPNNKNEIIVA